MKRHEAQPPIAIARAQGPWLQGEDGQRYLDGISSWWVNLFGHAKSYMEALAVIRPVLIIDEPHRFEGKQTQEYLARFNPLLTIRFGATFKKDEYKNLIYTLDSLEAFRQRLVKSITVDTVGAGADMAQVLCFMSSSGTGKERTAQVSD